jgi:hypothetical protein
MKAEKKYILIKEVERLLKENSIDCALNYHANIFPEEVIKYKNCNPINNYITDKTKPLCPLQCDLQNCSFKCNDKKLNLELYDNTSHLYKNISKQNLDYTTFTSSIARNEIEYIKNYIKELYKYKYVYTIDFLISIIKKNYPNKPLFDVFYVYKAIDELIPISSNDFNNFKDTIYDKFNIPGYLIYKDIYYIFQPFNQYENVPMYYRTKISSNFINTLSL